MKKIMIGLFSIGLLSATPLYANKIQNSVTSTQNSVTLPVENKSKNTIPVEINHGTVADFMTLKGIGAKKAGDIVAYRTTNGPFKSIDDLAQVKGIGKKALAKLQRNNPNRIILKLE